VDHLLKSHSVIAPRGSVVPDTFEVQGRSFSGLDALPRDQAERLYSRIVRYGSACGCGFAVVGATLAGPLYMLGLSVVLAIACAVVGAVVGMGLGLWIARRRFAAAGRRLESAVETMAQR
jgi:hypothetical protein